MPVRRCTACVISAAPVKHLGNPTWKQREEVFRIRSLQVLAQRCSRDWCVPHPDEKSTQQRYFCDDVCPGKQRVNAVQIVQVPGEKRVADAKERVRVVDHEEVATRRGLNVLFQIRPVAVGEFVDDLHVEVLLLPDGVVKYAAPIDPGARHAEGDGIVEEDEHPNELAESRLHEQRAIDEKWKRERNEVEGEVQPAKCDHLELGEGRNVRLQACRWRGYS
mmetsp:Transcript_18241/g.45608  ORF Transcript_18241/g.45608 Transcript_18241/m.45608 type:complete len:220 (+) Transcript_18241:859-1518(+)